MTFHDFIRGVFGLNRHDQWQNQPNRTEDEFAPGFRNPIWQTDDDDEDDDEGVFRNGPSISFHVFTNPLEIQRYFEQQLDELIRGFHQGGLGSDSFVGALNDSFGSFDGSLFGGRGQNFALPAPPDVPTPEDGKSLRELYLKPEFEPPSKGPQSFADSDLDGKIAPEEIGEILSSQSDSHLKSTAKPQFPSFLGKSTFSKTIRRSDGTIETHKTVRDSQGNEETTVTHQKGDQSYTVTIFKDANGEEKRTENFVNIDEGQIPNFKSILDNNRPMLPSSQPEDKRGPPAGVADDLSYWVNKFFKH